MTIETRVARVADAPIISRLLLQLGYDLPATDVGPRLAQSNPNDQVLVAEMAGSVVGLVSVSVRSILHLAGLCAAIDTLVVGEGNRSEG